MGLIIAVMPAGHDNDPRDELTRSERAGARTVTRAAELLRLSCWGRPAVKASPGEAVVAVRLKLKR